MFLLPVRCLLFLHSPYSPYRCLVALFGTQAVKADGRDYLGEGLWGVYTKSKEALDAAEPTDDPGAEEEEEEEEEEEDYPLGSAAADTIYDDEAVQG